MNNSLSFPNEGSCVVLIKAAPTIGEKHGETVCVAGVDEYGNWHRLYPVGFRDLKEHQKFARWDHISFHWRKAQDDQRPESKRINPQTIKRVGTLRPKERHPFAQRCLVENLDEALAAGNTFALIVPNEPIFKIRRKTADELNSAWKKLIAHKAQVDLFSESIVPKEPSPYAFVFEFENGGKRRKHVCIDWETEATYFKWRDEYGESDAIAKMKIRFGEEYPEKGMAFAMGTHRRFGSWLLSAIIRVDRTEQLSLF